MIPFNKSATKLYIHSVIGLFDKILTNSVPKEGAVGEKIYIIDNMSNIVIMASIKPKIAPNERAIKPYTRFLLIARIKEQINPRIIRKKAKIIKKLIRTKIFFATAYERSAINSAFSTPPT